MQNNKVDCPLPSVVDIGPVNISLFLRHLALDGTSVSFESELYNNYSHIPYQLETSLLDAIVASAVFLPHLLTSGFQSWPPFSVYTVSSAIGQWVTFHGFVFLSCGWESATQGDG